MNETTKGYLVSAGQTFVAAFLLAIFLSVQSGDGIEFNLSFLFSILMTAFRFAIKAVAQFVVPILTNFLSKKK